MSEELLREIKDGIATITINRPAQRNAMTFDMWHGLAGFVSELQANLEVRVVVIRGAGTQAFSAGADIAEFEEQRRNSLLAKEYHAAVEGAFRAIARCPKPTIAMIAGFCMGGGLELATAADLRIAADNSRFGIPTAKLGIFMPYWEMSQLVRLVGAGRALDMLLTAKVIDAEEAFRTGLVSRLVPLAELEQHTYQVAAEVAGYAPLSHRWHKKVLEMILSNPSLDGLTPEQTDLPFACFDTEDFQEGRRAFMEKRKPEFKGQ